MSGTREAGPAGPAGSAAGKQSGTEAAADVREAREQVEATREQLGETVAALADKTHVKDRAKARAARAAGAARATAAQRRQAARLRAVELKNRAQAGTTGVGDRVRRLGQADPRVVSRRTALAARQHPRVLAGVAAGIATAGVAVWWLVWRRRR